MENLRPSDYLKIMIDSLSTYDSDPKYEIDNTCVPHRKNGVFFVDIATLTISSLLGLDYSESLEKTNHNYLGWVDIAEKQIINFESKLLLDLQVSLFLASIGSLENLFKLCGLNYDDYPSVKGVYLGSLWKSRKNKIKCLISEMRNLGC